MLNLTNNTVQLIRVDPNSVFPPICDANNHQRLDTERTSFHGCPRPICFMVFRHTPDYNRVNVCERHIAWACDFINTTLDPVEKKNEQV